MNKPFEIEKFNQYDLPLNAKTSTCPLCSADRKKSRDKCLAIDWNTGLATCQHCGEVIQIHTYKKKHEMFQNKAFARPKWENRTELSDKVVKWFENRKISQFTLRRAKVSEGIEFMPQQGKKVNTIQFNYFRNDELVNVKYRDGAKNFKLFKDAEKIFYNLDGIRISESVIIVEGEIDALSFMEAGMFNVVSVPNGSTTGNVNLDYLDNSIEYFENKKKVYLCLDNDEPGQNTQRELIRRIGSEKCLRIDLSDCKDANEYLVKYGSERLAEAFNLAKEIPIDGVSSILDWKDDFEDYLLHGMQQGFKIGKRSFDNIFSTYTGQFVVVTGIPSSGKSDWVDEMCIGYSRQLKWKIAYASPENKPNKIHAGKLISKLCGKWVNHQNDLRTDWYSAAVGYIDEYFKFIDLDGTYDLDRVLEKARSLIFKFGIKVLVIDPYNKVRLKDSLSKNVNDYTNDYLIKIDEFARKHDILIFLVAHPTKPSQENRRVYEPTFYDIKGGGEFYDMSPHGLLVHRDYENNLVKVKVLKVKFNHLGRNQAYCWLKWNESNGRYTEYSNHSENADDLGMPLTDESNWMDVQQEQVEDERQLFEFPNPNKFYEQKEAPF